MAFGPSGAEQRASQYGQQYQGNLDSALGYGKGILDQGLASLAGMDGQGFAQKYSAYLGGLETSNASMKSIADRLANYGQGGMGIKALEDLALQNQGQEKLLRNQLGTSGLTSMGGTGLSALTSLRAQNQKTYADTVRQGELQGLQQAAGIYQQIGQNNASVFGMLSGADQGALNALLQVGGGIYNNALSGQGNLYGNYSQQAQANAAGRGSLFGGLLQGGLGLAGTLLGGPMGGMLGSALGGLFGGGNGGAGTMNVSGAGQKYIQPAALK